MAKNEQRKSYMNQRQHHNYKTIKKRKRFKRKVKERSLGRDVKKQAKKQDYFNIHKKPSAKQCNDYRTINLMNNFLKIIHKKYAGNIRVTQEQKNSILKI